MSLLEVIGWILLCASCLVARDRFPRSIVPEALAAQCNP